MHIIHLYPSHVSELAQYVSNLTSSLGSDCEATDEVKIFMQRCEQHRPDIVHLHDCQHADYIRAALTARQKGARIVLTPHGHLESWELDDLMKQPSGLQQLVTHAYCLIARSSIEAEELRKLGWNSRIEIIRNPILTKTTSLKSCVQQHLRVYRQVMDSYVLEKLSADSLHALRTLLRVALNDDSRWGEPFDAAAVEWHYLLIYAQQEGILHLLEKGAQLMGIPLPEKTAAPSYLPDGYRKPTSLAGKSIPDMVAAIRRQVGEGQLALLSLAELHQALHREEVEDDRVMELLQGARLSTFFAALLPVMNEQTGLTEGFMPCQPVDNNETKQIRTTIQKHLEI